jgi:hypothetical protein
MFGVIVALITIAVIGIYFIHAFESNSSQEISCNGCPKCFRNKQHCNNNNCSQIELKNCLPQIYNEDDNEPK